MENTIENTTPFYKRKVLVIPVVAVMMIALVAAAVVFATSHATVTVSEALSTVNLAVTPSGYAGETISQDITIKSLSSGDIPITIGWAPGNNTNSVIYTYTGPSTADIIANNDTVITLTWDIDSGSPNGDFDGIITLTRVSS